MGLAEEKRCKITAKYCVNGWNLPNTLHYSISHKIIFEKRYAWINLALTTTWSTPSVCLDSNILPGVIEFQNVLTFQFSRNPGRYDEDNWSSILLSVTYVLSMSVGQREMRLQTWMFPGCWRVPNKISWSTQAHTATATVGHLYQRILSAPKISQALWDISIDGFLNWRN